MKIMVLRYWLLDQFLKESLRVHLQLQTSDEILEKYLFRRLFTLHHVEIESLIQAKENSVMNEDIVMWMQL